MNKTRNVAAAFVILGFVFIAMGYRYDPPRMLTVAAGVAFIIAGIVRLMGARSAR